MKGINCANHPDREALIAVQVPMEEFGLGKRSFALCRECATEQGLEPLLPKEERE